MARLWGLIAGVTAAAVATAIGLGIFVLINALPAFIWRAEYLMVSWLVTLPLGVVLGTLGLVKFMGRLYKWLNSGAKLAEGEPGWARLAAVVGAWLAAVIAVFASVPI